MSELTGPLAAHEALLAPKIALMKQRLDNVPLKVLVFGPGPGHEAYAKRLQIREALSEIPNVLVLFPDGDSDADREMAALIERKYLIRDPLKQEDVLAQMADVIIVLERSSGPVNEVARFSGYPAIAPKLYLLLHSVLETTATTSYPGRLRDKLDKHYYTDEQYSACTVATVVCPERIQNEKLARLFRQD